MISVIISNPSITVKCAPCEDSIVMNTKKACENNPFPHAFFRSFSVRNNGFSLSSSDDSLIMLLGQMPRL